MLRRAGVRVSQSSWKIAQTGVGTTHSLRDRRNGRGDWRWVCRNESMRLHVRRPVEDRRSQRSLAWASRVPIPSPTGPALETPGRGGCSCCLSPAAAA